MKGNTGKSKRDKSEHGQTIAWVTALAAEAPRIGMDIEEEDAQVLIDGTENDRREKLNARLWKALGTRRRVSIPAMNSFDVCAGLLARVSFHGSFPPATLEGIKEFFYLFRLRSDPGERAEIELMCFDTIFGCLSGPIVKARYRGFERPAHEDAIHFAAYAKPSELRMGEDKRWPVVFPHDSPVPDRKHGAYERCITLDPQPDDTWRVRLVGYHEHLPRQCFYAFREKLD